MPQKKHPTKKQPQTLPNKAKPQKNKKPGRGFWYVRSKSHFWKDNHRNFHHNTEEKVLRLLRDYLDDLFIDGTSNYY